MYRNIACYITRKNGEIINSKILRHMSKQRLLSIMSNSASEVIIKRVDK